MSKSNARIVKLIKDRFNQMRKIAHEKSHYHKSKDLKSGKSIPFDPSKYNFYDLVLDLWQGSEYYEALYQRADSMSMNWEVLCKKKDKLDKDDTKALNDLNTANTKELKIIKEQNKEIKNLKRKLSKN